MQKKGLMPLWATAILGVILILIGAYMAIALFASPLAFWSGIVLIIIGLGMIAITMILS